MYDDKLDGMIDDELYQLKFQGIESQAAGNNVQDAKTREGR
jgi:hypothetical protein